MHEIFQFVFHIFWHHSTKDKAEAQNFKNFVKLSVKSSYIIRFSQIPRYRQTRTVSLRVFAENVQFRFFSEYTINCRKRTVLPCIFANNDQFNSVLLQITRSLTPLFCQKRSKRGIRKRTVTKPALSLTSCFQRQRSAMLRAFGKNGELSKTLNNCANFKNVFENVG